MAKAPKPTVPLTGRVGILRGAAPDGTALVDKQTMIQAALNQCNIEIGAIVTAQLVIRKDVTQATADVLRASYRKLERQRRHVHQQRHQIQVASFTLDGWTIERLTQRLSAIMTPLEA